MQNLAKLLFAGAVVAFAGAPLATAAAMSSQATLAAPVSEPKTVIIDGKVWKCTGADCAASAAGSSQPLTRECVRAVKILGKVTAFSRDGKSLDATQLAACNAAA